MNKGDIIFITGTDTGAGKTFVSALLLNYLKRVGISAAYQKWVATGTPEGEIPDDLAFCLGVAGYPSLPEELDLLVPCRFEYPASPHFASEMEGKKVDIDKIALMLEKLLKKYRIVVAEGVGGLLVPLTRQKVLADFVSGMGVKTIIVARSGLGTINHTLLTLEALRKRNIPILGVVFSDASSVEDEAIVSDNIKIIEELGGVEVFGRLKRYGDSREAVQSFESIGDKIFGKIRISLPPGP